MHRDDKPKTLEEKLTPVQLSTLKDLLYQPVIPDVNKLDESDANKDLKRVLNLLIVEGYIERATSFWTKVPVIKEFVNSGYVLTAKAEELKQKYK